MPGFGPGASTSSTRGQGVDAQQLGFAELRSNLTASYAGLTRVSIHLHWKLFSKGMDHRVKPGDDAENGGNALRDAVALNQDPSRKHPAWGTKPGHDEPGDSDWTNAPRRGRSPPPPG